MEKENVKNTENAKTRMQSMHGSVVAAALALVAVLLFFEGVYMVNFVYKTGETIRVVKETEITDAIDFVEAAKRGLQDAVEYSVYKASNDVLLAGGFCEHGSDVSSASYCSESCKTPYGVPTLGCEPWWRIYGSVYDPRTFYGIGSPGAAVGPDYGITNRTYQRFGEYAALFESKSNNKFGAPQYCPRPSGTPGIVFTDGADPTASVTVENKDADGNDVEMTYEGGFFTIADNSTFSGTAGLTAFALLDFARDEFAASDYVADQFDAADNAMQARCKRIDLGDVCVGSLSSCEDELPAGCDKTYNDTVKSSLNGYADKTDSHGNQFRITASTSEPDDCVKVGHSSSRRESGRFSVGWKDEDTAGNCAKINAEGCGCADYCTGNEDSCGSCKGNGITAGTFDGKCPTGSPWVDKKITCPAECCAMEWSCTESQADSGAWRHEITLGCRANACEQKCCEQTAALAENVVCTYEYFGTASASVEVSDAAHSYPLGNGMTNLKIPFYAVSGNVPASEANCAAATWDAAGQKMDYNAWGAKESSLCCPASVSDDSECKTGKT